jgi:hypothetical protein
MTSAYPQLISWAPTMPCHPRMPSTFKPVIIKESIQIFLPISGNINIGRGVISYPYSHLKSFKTPDFHPGYDIIWNMYYLSMVPIKRENSLKVVAVPTASPFHPWRPREEQVCTGQSHFCRAQRYTCGRHQSPRLPILSALPVAIRAESLEMSIARAGNFWP